MPIVCLPVRGDNLQALASGLSPVQGDKPWYSITILYRPHQCRSCSVKYFVLKFVIFGKVV